jgi:hypothetical protein
VAYLNRGRCAELISYWQFITTDKNSMAQAYFTATRKMEEGEEKFVMHFCIDFKRV